jgi:hypothetical protein
MTAFVSQVAPDFSADAYDNGNFTRVRSAKSDRRHCLLS